MAEANEEQQERWADEFLRALGYLLVQANEFEEALVYLYTVVSDKEWSEVHEDVRGRTLGPLLQLVVKAFETRFPNGELRDSFERLRPDLQRAADVRNQFVHASWAFDYANEQMHRRRLPRKSGALQELRRLKVADVDAAIDVIGVVAERIMDELYDPVAAITPKPHGELIPIDSDH